jgi:hypothetical protein
MGKKLYVGNLAYSIRDNDLEQAFSQYGSVASAKVMMERDSGRSKGFGFVEMGTDAEALAAHQQRDQLARLVHVHTVLTGPFDDCLRDESPAARNHPRRGFIAAVGERDRGRTVVRRRHNPSSRR